MADQEGAGETRPKQEGQVINLIVKDQLGGEVHFKVKSHTKLEKVGNQPYVTATAQADQHKLIMQQVLILSQHVCSASNISWLFDR